MTRAIARVSVDQDSGHHGYGKAIAWSDDQTTQQSNQSGKPSEKAKGPYAGSGDVLIGTEKLGVTNNVGDEIVGYGVHRQYDFREEHIPMGDSQPEGRTVRLEGAEFPWLKTASDTVFVNSRGAGRKGDFTICGAAIRTGNETVQVGGSDPDINLDEVPILEKIKIELEPPSIEIELDDLEKANLLEAINR
jgi:uncharacterized Zn-binding protein involved in type VI secretion